MAPPVLKEIKPLCPTNLPRIVTDLLPSPLTSDSSEFRSSRDENETVLQEFWDKSISKYMDRPDGYHAVHVLVIKWQDEIDQLRVREEVNQLSGVFRDHFNYEVTEVELGTMKAQLQLGREIHDWAFKNDGPDNLLIVYYAGHGVYDKKTRKLEFSPTNDQDKGPVVVWNTAERTLVEDVQADVFAIMDCCYASDLLRNIPEYGRTYEMLCASPIGLPTAQPGENSFTTRLIKHLMVLADEHAETFFTTRDIDERMKKDLKFEPPVLWRRIPGTSRHIRLSKLKPLSERPNTNKELHPHSHFLHLGFALKNETFQEKHIEGLTKKLPALFKEGIPVVDIKWLGCRIVGHPTFKEVADFVYRHRRDLSAISPKIDAKRNAVEMDSKEGPRENTARSKRRKNASKSARPDLGPTLPR